MVEWRAANPEFVGSSLGTGTAVFIFFQSNTIKKLLHSLKKQNKTVDLHFKVLGMFLIHGAITQSEIVSF